MYIVCQTPSCQQTYPLDGISDKFLRKRSPVFCDNCNGILVSKDGSIRISQNSNVIQVCGDWLLNAIYEKGEVINVKLKTSTSLHEWDYRSGLYLNDFLAVIASITLTPCNPNVKLIKQSVDEMEMTNDIEDILSSIYNVKVNKKGILKYRKKKEV